MKRGLLVAVGVLARLVARLQVWAFWRAAGDRDVVVLDIDNTLADTWPSFLAPYSGHRDRLSRLDPLPHVKPVAHDGPVAAGAAVLFLSHRNLWEWPVTVRWLRRHGYAAGFRNLVLVPDPFDKVAHIGSGVTTPSGRPRRIVVWDDLSGGHELGAFRRYDEVVEALGALGVDHHGWDEIVALTGLGLERGPGPDRR